MDSARVDGKDRTKVICVVGTRPEAIKMFPVIQKLKESELLEPFVVSSGQHTDLLKPIFDLAEITPDVDLGVGKTKQSLNGLVSLILNGLEEVITDLRLKSPTDSIPSPASILVHGDTTTAMASALSAAQAQLPVIHVEAGLRTGDTLHPFPEELNRQIIARIAAFHMAPTTHNLDNLVKERVRAERIFVTGNTGIDALMWTANRQVKYSNPELEAITKAGKPIVVVTAHRRENWNGGLGRIAQAIAELATLRPNVNFVISLHPNPLVREEIIPKVEGLDNVLLTEPLDYPEFARLLKDSTIVITDSGGIQEEAPSLQTPVLVAREETERSEGVEAGTLILVGTDTQRIVNSALELLDNPQALELMKAKSNPYGDGFASARIVSAIENIGYGTPAPLPFGNSFSRSAVLNAAGYQDIERSDIELYLKEEHGPDYVYKGPERRNRAN